MQMEDNIHWIREAGKNKLVVGSQARILYADSEGRIGIALAFNKAIREGRLKGPGFRRKVHNAADIPVVDLLVVVVPDLHDLVSDAKPPLAADDTVPAGWPQRVEEAGVRLHPIEGADHFFRGLAEFDLADTLQAILSGPSPSPEARP